jgi:putative flippase GtrA
MLNELKIHIRPYKKIIKFLASGGTAAVMEFVVFFILEYFTGINTMAAQAASFCCGLIVSFILNKFWVFEFKANSTYKKGAAFFLTLGVSNLVITTLLMGILPMYIPSFAAKIILMVCVAVWNYLIFKAR